MSDEQCLIGRDHEVAHVRRLVAGAREQGGALVIEGAPGIGKSALVAEAVRAAGDDLQVMRAVGVQSESHLPFAGLHQLLRPLLVGARVLPGPQHDALATAFGMAEGTVPESFLIGLGTLGLLSEAAHERPLLVVVDDAQWLDRPSAAALAFVARRVQSDPIVMLVTVREGYQTPLHEAGLPGLPLERLADAASRQLLGTRFPALEPAMRERVVAEAEGNPLALLEFAASPETLRTESGSPLPDPRALTARLEQALAARLTELPPATRTLVRVAAADEGSALATVLAAGSLVDGADRTLEDLLPAVEARLVELDEDELRFRHPLVRSAVYQAADVAERNAVHRALAEVFETDADRRAWHAAAASTSGPDAALAADLEAAGRRAQERGAVPTAAAAFERGAAFAEDPLWRGRLLLQAAGAAAELGRAETVNALLRQAEALPLGLHEQAQSLLIGDAFREGQVGDRVQIRALRDTGTRLADEGDHHLALDLFTVAATRCYLSSLSDEGRDVVHQAERVTLAGPDPRLSFIQAFGAPIDRDAAVLSLVSEPVAAIEAHPAAHLRGLAICLRGRRGRGDAAVGRLRPETARAGAGGAARPDPGDACVGRVRARRRGGRDPGRGGGLDTRRGARGRPPVGPGRAGRAGHDRGHPRRRGDGRAAHRRDRADRPAERCPDGPRARSAGTRDPFPRRRAPRGGVRAPASDRRSGRSGLASAGAAGYARRPRRGRGLLRSRATRPSS